MCIGSYRKKKQITYIFFTTIPGQIHIQPKQAVIIQYETKPMVHYEIRENPQNDSLSQWTLKKKLWTAYFPY